ncbi:MAG: NAD(+)/NADH kinase [Ruminococcaceae bacterium]|nr:NAD(+)/NADH kinase [Oscillospiraceae bacterium]
MEKKLHDLVLVTNKYKDRDLAWFHTVLDYLVSIGFNIRIPSEFAVREHKNTTVYSDLNEMYKGADGAVLLGGDGTILNAAEYAIPNDCPMIGINLGRMGYLAELEPEEYSMLARLASGDYRIEERMTLCVEIEDEGKRTVLCENALNDAVVQHTTGLHCIDLQLSCDNASVLGYRGNGLIIATPTGSTAYSLSAGGPVLDPALRCMNVVPICCVSPAAKPLVFAGNSVMTVENVFDREDNVLLNIDGKITVPLPYGAKAICTGAEKSARMIKIKDNKFFSVLRAKIS